MNQDKYVFSQLVARYSSPEIINSDQGVQYTCEQWHKACNKYGIRISMDGRARCLDNVWIERFWRTIKREYVYLNPESTVCALRNGIRRYIDYYNNRRPPPGPCTSSSRSAVCSGLKFENEYLEVIARTTTLALRKSVLYAELYQGKALHHTQN